MKNKQKHYLLSPLFLSLSVCVCACFSFIWILFLCFVTTEQYMSCDISSKSIIETILSIKKNIAFIYQENIPRLNLIKSQFILDIHSAIHSFPNKQRFTNPEGFSRTVLAFIRSCSSRRMICSGLVQLLITIHKRL